MMNIKPRVEDGVPWCDAGCPQGTNEPRGVTFCAIDKLRRETFDCSIHFEVCPHAVKRMAVELDRLNNGWKQANDDLLTANLRLEKAGLEIVPAEIDFPVYDTIEAATDALMAEREE